jgi:hypothetical protein
VTIDGKHDWRGGLLEAARRQGAPAVRATLVRTLEAGVDAGAVKQFVVEHRAVFGDPAALFGDVDVGRRAADRLLDQTQPRLSAPPSLSGRAVRPHAVRLDPHGALPWHQRVALPTLPVTFAADAPVDVGVQGQRFAAADVARLLAG